jgi:hypothetical protein
MEKELMLGGHSVKKLILVAELLDAHPELWKNIAAGYCEGYTKGRADAIAAFEKVMQRQISRIGFDEFGTMGKTFDPNTFKFAPFKNVSIDGGLDIQGEPAQQPTYTGEKKPF